MGLDLRPYGYAPGGYSFKCVDCPPDTDPMSQWAAKRAWRCEKHAKIAMALAIEFPAPAAGPKTTPVDGEVRFNINHYVRVKLNEKGLAELKRQHQELYDRYPGVRAWQPPKTDAEGYSRFQLWDLMKSLGHLCLLGMEPPFDTNILIDTGQR